MTRILSLLLPLLLLLAGCKSKQLIRVLTTGTVEGPETFYHELPFTESSGLIIVEVLIAGEPRRLVFDTGTPNVITAELARELELIPILRDKVADSQEQVEQLEFTTVAEFTIGDVHFRDFGAVIVDWSSVPQLRCLDIDGLLGANLMRRACWQIDYQEMVVRMASDCDAFNFSADTMEIPFHTSLQGTPYVDMTINGLHYKDVLVDLGSNSKLTVSPTMYRRINQHDSLPPPLTAVGYGSAGIYGQVMDTIQQGFISSMQLNEHPLQVNSTRVTGKDHKGVLGNGFFVPYRPVINWKRQRVILSPPDITPATPFRTHGITVGFAEGRARIDMIYLNSAAEAAGLQVGQEIVRLEEFYLQRDGQQAFCELFVNRSALLDRLEISLEVVTENGIRTITLPLIEYLR